MSEDVKVKLDCGCGKNVKPGFDGIDIVNHGQKYIMDLRDGFIVKKELEGDIWDHIDGSDISPIWSRLKDNSVDEVYSRYFIPCLTNYNDKYERVRFFNELYRIMKHNSSCTIVVPNWNSAGGYGNPTYHEPIYEGSLYYLNKYWRDVNAPELTEYTCNFDPVWGYNMHQSLLVRNQEYQQFALSNYSNAAIDIVITIKKIV